MILWFPWAKKIDLGSYVFHIVDTVLRNLLERDSFTGTAVVFGHQGPALPSTPVLCCAFTLPSSCWLQHSPAYSELFQIINQAENNSLFFVAKYTVLRDWKRNEISFRASSTIPTVPAQPYQKSDFKPLLQICREYPTAVIWAVDRLYCTAQAEIENFVNIWYPHNQIKHLIFQLNCKPPHWY